MAEERLDVNGGAPKDATGLMVAVGPTRWGIQIATVRVSSVYIFRFRLFYDRKMRPFFSRGGAICQLRWNPFEN